MNTLKLIKTENIKSKSKSKAKDLRDEIDKAIDCFQNWNTGKFGNYVSTTNALVYRTIVTASDGSLEMRQDLCAIRFKTGSEAIFLGNSAVLPNIGRTVSFGNVKNNRSQTDIQARLSRLMPMLPFNVFLEAGLDLFQAKIIQRGPEETVTRLIEWYNSKTKKDEKIPETVHYTGASLFTVGGKCFLFDIDRREIKHGIFNPFLVELTKPCSTIEDAYHALKPKEVLEAEEQGLKVLRQGEWFFIPVNKEFKPIANANRRFNRSPYMSAELRAGNNQPNRVSKFYGKTKKTKYGNEYSVEYVSGTVEHSGREHASLELPGWYKPVPNTSIRSFTVTGDID